MFITRLKLLTVFYLLIAYFSYLSVNFVWLTYLRSFPWLCRQANDKELHAFVDFWNYHLLVDVNDFCEFHAWYFVINVRFHCYKYYFPSHSLIIRCRNSRHKYLFHLHFYVVDESFVVLSFVGIHLRFLVESIQL